MNEDVRCSGGKQRISLKSEYRKGQYTHEKTWWLTPYSNEDFRLKIYCFEHQKTHVENEKSHKVKNLIAWKDGKIKKETIPEKGRELIRNTFKTSDIFCEGGSKHNIVSPSIDKDIYIDDFEVTRKASKNEWLDSENKIKHSYKWSFKPAEDGGFKITRYLHKTWDKQVKMNKKENYPGERLVEAKSHEDCPKMSELPTDVITSLCKTFGRDIIEKSVRRTGGELPQFVYECPSCDQVKKSPPLNNCDNCGQDMLVVHDTFDDYKDSLDSDSRELIEKLAESDIEIKSD